jgi:hypothetical protein
MPTTGAVLSCRRLARMALLFCAIEACSPTSRMKVRFVAPGIGAAMSAERFHLTGRKECPPAPVAEPAPSAMQGQIEYVQMNVETEVFVVLAAFRGAHCTARLTGWYDADGNGVVSQGDLVGVTNEVDITDRGLFSDNLTVLNDVRMRRVP